MDELLLGGPSFEPATYEKMLEFKRLVKQIPDLTAEEWRTLQRIEWGLSESEYIALKFPNRRVERPQTRGDSED